MDLAKYRKFIVAIIGFGVLYAKEIMGIELDDGIVNKIVEGIISVLSLVGIFMLRNKTTVSEARESQKSMV
jgi:uncharacterized membrane protein